MAAGERLAHAGRPVGVAVARQELAPVQDERVARHAGRGLRLGLAVERLLGQPAELGDVGDRVVGQPDEVVVAHEQLAARRAHPPEHVAQPAGADAGAGLGPEELDQLVDGDALVDGHDLEALGGQAEGEGDRAAEAVDGEPAQHVDLPGRLLRARARPHRGEGGVAELEGLGLLQALRHAAAGVRREQGQLPLGQLHPALGPQVVELGEGAEHPLAPGLAPAGLGQADARAQLHLRRQQRQAGQGLLGRGEELHGLVDVLGADAFDPR